MLQTKKYLNPPINSFIMVKKKSIELFNSTNITLLKVIVSFIIIIIIFLTATFPKTIEEISPIEESYTAVGQVAELPTIKEDQPLERDTNIPSSLIINYPLGWNIISFSLLPNDNSVEGVFKDYTTDLVLLNDNFGNAYIPTANIATLQSFDIQQGYVAYFNRPIALQISGQPVNIATPISLNQGQNIVPYYYQNSLPVTQALNSIIDKIAYVVYYAGTDQDLSYRTILCWSPYEGWCKGQGYIALENLESGRGYVVWMNEPAKLQY